jgi:hypothetical protein
MTETTPEPAAVDPEATAAEATETTEAEDTEAEDTDDVWLTRRSQRPRVTMEIRLPTDPDSWGPDGKSLGTGPWNAPYVSRPGVTIQAREVPFAFRFELPDYRTVDCNPGDWLIRDTESGYVFALTKRAFGQLFEAAPAADAPAAAAPEA